MPEGSASELMAWLRQRFGTERTVAAFVVNDGISVGCVPDDHEHRRFELGSIAKTFTAALLAEQVVLGNVSLDDQIGTWLDAGPNRDITLLQLATHTSGLPRLAPNAMAHPGFDEDDPYAAFTAELAEAGLREAARSDVGTPVYSNFGFQLLGLVLERLTGSPFAALADRGLFQPLGMSTVGLNGSSRLDLVGHTRTGEVRPWRLALPSPGGFAGSIHDLLAYAQAVLDPPSTPLGEAITLTLTPRVGDRGLAWRIDPSGRHAHHGGTGGFESVLVLDRSRRSAWGALVNEHRGTTLDHIVARFADGWRPADGSREEPAELVVRRILAHEWDELRSSMADALRDVLTVERLEAVTVAEIDRHGPLDRIEVLGAWTLGGGIHVDVAAHQAHGETEYTVGFGADGCLTGVFLTGSTPVSTSG